MALNKRKVLEAARKHAQKGAKAKALKEYNKLLKADARDAKLLLEVGDAYRRWGQAEEAIAQYGKVAQQYRQDGFDARAVAVFKQILNLDPKHYSAYVSLSELYQRMGLDSEAISALQTAADGYHKEGRKAEALDLLRQTAALDPTNTTSRLKVAELLRQEGMDAEALSEYQAVAEELENQQDREQVIVVLERILELKPDQVDALTSLVKNLMADRAFERAETFAVRLLQASAEPPQYELLMELYSQSGDDAKLAEATRGLAKLHRDRGDEETARTLMQRLPVDEIGSSSRLAVDVSEVDEPDLADEELLEEEPFLTLDEESDAAEAAAATPEPEIGLDLESDGLELEPNGKEANAGEAGPPEPLPEGDPDQLLAEANVYLRYGKRDQAIASLRGVLAQDENHRAALDKLGEAYAADGQNEEAVQAWLRAAVQIRAAGDAEALSVLKDRVAALDPAAAEQIGSVDVSAAAAPEEAEDVAEIALELDCEVELNLDEAIDEVAHSETQTGFVPETDASSGADDEAQADEDDDEFEIELDDDSFEMEAEADADGANENTGATTDSISLDTNEDLTLEPEIDLAGDTESDLVGSDVTEDVALEDQEVEFDFDVDELTNPEAGSSPGESTTTAAKIAEELEEAEFYFEQDMYDEAEEIVQRVLDLVPNHPSAMLRMGEIAAARGEHPDGEAATGAADEVAAANPEQTFDTEAEQADSEADAEADAEEMESTSEDVELTVDEDEISAELDAAAELDASAAVDDDTSDEIEEDTNEAEPAEATESVEADSAEADTPEAAEEGVEEVAAEAEAEPEAAAADEADTRAETEADTDAEDHFDLREALADVLTDDEESLPSDDTSSGVLSTVEDGFGSIFSDFKKGVTATLEEGDFETRYDLGIAYREMGLFEDAIGEFRVCLDSPARRFDSLHLMGVCASDLSRFADAVNHFEQALALPEIPEERLAGVYFDLSMAQAGAGQIERACASLRRTLEMDAEFPTAAERLAELEAGGDTSPKLADPNEGFESFDELFDEDDEGDAEGDAAMAEAVPAEAFESFDDVVAEAEEMIQDAVPEASSAEEADGSDAADDDTQSNKKSGRKKISFV